MEDSGVAIGVESEDISVVFGSGRGGDGGGVGGDGWGGGSGGAEFNIWGMTWLESHDRLFGLAGFFASQELESASR